MTAKIFHPLLSLIASATDRELARYVEFLKEENKILRARIPGQVHTKPHERSRLIKFGKALGQAVEELLTIVTPQTFYRWCREEQSGKKKLNPKGGQRKPREIRDLVIEIATTTSFGYTRIIGELRKLGIKGISRQTVRNILKEEGIQPGPNRTSDCWDNFVKRHAETLWAVDFFSVKTVTARGLQEMYLMAFLCLSSREVIVSAAFFSWNASVLSDPDRGQLYCPDCEKYRGHSFQQNQDQWSRIVPTSGSSPSGKSRRRSTRGHHAA